MKGSSKRGMWNVECRSPHVSKGGSSDAFPTRPSTSQAETRPVGRVSLGTMNAEW